MWDRACHVSCARCMAAKIRRIIPAVPPFSRIDDGQHLISKVPENDNGLGSDRSIDSHWRRLIDASDYASFQFYLEQRIRLSKGGAMRY
jgi:hypothetical protein